MNVQIKAQMCRFLQRPQSLGVTARPGATWTARSTSCNDLISCNDLKTRLVLRLPGRFDRRNQAVAAPLSQPRNFSFFFLTGVFLGGVGSEFGLIIEIQKELKVGFLRCGPAGSMGQWVPPTPSGVQHNVLGRCCIWSLFLMMEVKFCEIFSRFSITC